PYRNQLNFTFDGLKQAAASVDRLQNLRLRLREGKFPEGSNPAMAELARATVDGIRAGMEDDLNTAQAQAAIFDMARAANAAIDSGQLRKDDVPALLGAIAKFEEIFAVLNEDDVSKMKGVMEWAISEGRENEISAELRAAVASSKLDDQAINQKIAEMESARRARDFRRSDAIRAELTSGGVIVENTKDGVRWRRK